LVWAARSDANSYVNVDASGRTSAFGVWAAGDVAIHALK
jgi:thioredoxin reductase